MDSVMIALLPVTTSWSKLEIPHLTLVYSGKISDHKLTDFNAMAKDAASLAMLTRALVLQVMNVDIMGPPEEQVDALILRPTTELMAMRSFVEKWDRSEYPTYRPHATIGDHPSGYTNLPNQLAFDRVMVGWGEEQLIFWLKH